jgi:predicted HicB family RNase H-like nuclease
MALQRTHILLKPEQQKALVEIAQQEGRSVSDLAREIIQQGIDERQKQQEELRAQRLATLEKLRLLRESILARRGGKPFDLDVVQLIKEMREERVDDILGLGR